MKQYLTILLMSDAVAGGNGVELDPLSTPVGDVDLSRPIAPPANYEMSIPEASVGPNKAQTGRNLVLKCKSTKEIKSVKGDIMPAGSLVLTKHLPLQASDKMSIKQVSQSIARWARGFGLPPTLSAADIIANPTVFNGRTGLVKVAHKQETSEFPEGNEIKDVVIEG